MLGIIIALTMFASFTGYFLITPLLGWECGIALVIILVTSATITVFHMSKDNEEDKDV